MFQVNISDIPTISSLALQIYRSNFMPEHARIGITDAKLYDKLHAAYMGGAVDVYTPQSEPMHTVYCYDVNSMYPAVMRDMDYPVGPPTFFEGHIDLNDHNTFGFLRVQVTAPKDLFAPLLMTRVGGRTVAPLGTWTAWYFSEELKLALTLGYEFKVLEGILYERGKIFSGYVDTLYKLRKSYASDDPRNLICKLLLNSLYGKFGMSPHLTEWKLVRLNPDFLRSLTAGKLPADFIQLDGETALVGSDTTKNKVVKGAKAQEEALAIISKKYNIPLDQTLDFLGNSVLIKEEYNNLIKQPKYLNISLPISVAVTAYGRMNIYAYKAYVIKNGGTLYYSDTDSVYTSIKLPDSLISSKLGAMKLEAVAARAIFLAPKVYALQFEDGSTVFKIKGSNNNFGLKFTDLEKLLYKEATLSLDQEKWFRSLTQSTINIRKTLYTLKVTANKRELIYTDNIFVATTPLIINDSDTNVVTYEASQFAVQRYSPFIYADVSPRFVIRFWNRVAAIHPITRSNFKPGLMFYYHSFLNYPISPLIIKCFNLLILTGSAGSIT